MIVHIFRKDCGLLYPLALIVAAIHLVNALLSATLGVYMEPRELIVVARLLPYVSMVGIIVLTAVAVHQEPLPETSEDFLVRPIRRQDLLLAKLLFVAVIVLGPVFVSDVLESMLSGFDLRTSLAAGFADALSKFLLLALPAMAIASVSRNLTELIAGSLSLIVLCAGLMMVLSVVRTGGPAPLSSSGLAWIRPVSIAIVFLVIGTVVLSLQYARRATVTSRWMIGFAGLLAAMLWMFIPWAAGFSVQQRAGVNDPEASRVTLAYAPEIGRFRQKEGFFAVAAPGDSGSLVPLFLPLRFEGVPSDALLLMDRAEVRIRNANGKTLFESTGPAYARNTARLRKRTSDITGAGGSFATFERLSLPASLFARLKNVDSAVDIEYSFTVMRPQPAQVIAALGGDDLTDGRRCRARPGDAGEVLEVGCLSAKRAPSCASVYLRHDPTGIENPHMEACLPVPDYSPYPLTLDTSILKRFGASIPFYDAERSAPYPVNARMLQDSHVVVVPYEAVTHVSRHVAIPAVRIGDWQAEL